MKKIIAVILLMACVVGATSCSLFDRINNKKQNASIIENYQNMFAISIPTKAETVVTETMSSVVLESVVTITTGTVDGKKASVVTTNIQSLNDIDVDKFRDLSLNLIAETSNVRWYYEGMGTSTNRGKTWDSEGVDFAPKAGSITLNLDASVMENIEYKADGNTEYLTFDVSKANAAKVLGDYVESSFKYDCNVKITASGGRISGVEISYSIESHELGDMDAYVEVEQIDMVVKASYSYDLQEITFD